MLTEVGAAGVDAIVCGGDVIVGPMSREVLDRLGAVSVPVRYLHGNCEVAVLEQLEGKAPAAMPERFRPTIAWTAEQIGSAHAAAIAAWPKTQRLHIDGIGDVVFCHGTPRDDNEVFTRVTDEQRLLPLFEPLEAALVVCGHSHMQFDRRVGRTRVVNAGSVGMPWGRPGADWLLLGPDVQLRRTSYDTSSAAAAVRTAGYPDPDGFFAHNVVSPPSVDEMERMYEGVSLRRA